VSARRSNRRIRLLVAVFAAVFAVTFLRAAWLQAVEARALGRLASDQHRQTVPLPAHRGAIYDRTGAVLAIGERATTVAADPRQIGNPRAVAIAVGHALGVEPGRFLPLLSDRSRGFVYLARKADPQKVAALERKQIAGLEFTPEERRSYPQRQVGAETVGYAGTDNHGLAGLELEYDHALAGKDGSETTVRDPFGRTLQTLHETRVRDGRDLYLTLDHTLQAQVERVLRETRAKWAAKSATAVVMDPRTGGILAMAVEPGFDANAFPEVRRDLQRNRAVTDTYEPGSTFKVVTIGGALEIGLVSPGTRYTLPPSIRIADRVIHDAEERPTETMTVARILSQSSNVGVVTVALGLGKTHLDDWIGRFGFGRPTGIDFPGESRGIVLPPDKWSGSTIGNVPIGQGIAVTPLQMLAAYGAIANRGEWVQPHLLDRIAGETRFRPKRRRVLSPQTADELTRMLEDVVAEGTGTLAFVPGYQVAGKTGTAAKPEPGGGYSDSRYVASFVGFVPAEHPRLVILVTVDEPHGAIWGGAVAAPAFAQIAQFGLQYLEVPPDARITAGGLSTGSATAGG
jgi:cell division protein FtsI (penicillin-binding protein 3)